MSTHRCGLRAVHSCPHSTPPGLFTVRFHCFPCLAHVNSVGVRPFRRLLLSSCFSTPGCKLLKLGREDESARGIKGLGGERRWGAVANAILSCQRGGVLSPHRKVGIIRRGIKWRRHKVVRLFVEKKLSSHKLYTSRNNLAQSEQLLSITSLLPSFTFIIMSNRVYRRWLALKYFFVHIMGKHMMSAGLLPFRPWRVTSSNSLAILFLLSVTEGKKEPIIIHSQRCVGEGSEEYAGQLFSVWRVVVALTFKTARVTLWRPGFTVKHGSEHLKRLWMCKSPTLSFRNLNKSK